MKILVVGAGIVGTVYGWALSEGGHQVVHLVRSGKANRLRNGVLMDVYDRRRRHKRYFRGSYLLNVTEAIAPSDCYDLVVVPTKHYQLEETLTQVVPHAGDADFLLLTQNWQGTEAVDSILPRARYVYGDAKAGGTYFAETLVSTLSSVDLGPAEGPVTPLTQKIAASFELARIPTSMHEDMLHYLWVQYAIVGGLWPSLVRAGSIDAALRDPRAVEMATAAVQECLEVVARRGVNLGNHPETKLFLTPSGLRRWLGLWMFKMALRCSEFVRRSSAHALNDPTEIKVFYDDLVISGRQLELPMPVMNSYAPDIARFVDRARRTGERK